MYQNELVMRDGFYTRIRRGMKIYDRNGDKIGTVKEVVCRLSRSLGATGQPLYAEGFITGDCADLGLNSELYIPFNNVSNVTDVYVLLDVDKSAVGRMGWDQRPTIVG